MIGAVELNFLAQQLWCIEIMSSAKLRIPTIGLQLFSLYFWTGDGSRGTLTYTYTSLNSKDISIPAMHCVIINANDYMWI